MSEPWYVKSFGAAYMDLYAHRTNSEAAEQIKAMVELIKPDCEGPTLDLCCGAGRHLKALRDLGMKRLTGLDLSHELLAVADEALNNSVEDAVEIVQGDMREIPRQNYYVNIFSLFTSFGYFTDDSDNAAVINGIYGALRPNGKFLMDYLNRDYIIENLVKNNSVESNGYTARNKRWITTDGKRVEKHTVVIMDSGEQHEFNESVRMYSEDEMRTMCKDAGFGGIEVFGGLDKQRLSPNSSRMIITAVK